MELQQWERNELDLLCLDGWIDGWVAMYSVNKCTFVQVLLLFPHLLLYMW